MRGVAERKRGRGEYMKHDKENEVYARQLRKDMTPWERKLWYCFLKDYPVRFQRQKCIDHYIADFYCFRANLVLELDGSQHCEASAVEYDHKRTVFLRQQWLLVLRFSNRDIMERFRSVCETIDTTVRDRLPG